MLQEVLIENLAIIKKMHVTFEDGLNIITGETGAGKSVVLHALGLLSGARAGKAMIRTGCTQAYVEGHFAVSNAKTLHAFFSEMDVDEKIILSRTVSHSGRSTFRVQGQLVSMQEFRNIGQSLLDVYGQKDRMLLDQENQLGLLDMFLREEAVEQLTHYQNSLHRWKELCRFISESVTDRASREREADILRYQMDEIEQFDVDGTDIDAMYAEHSKLLHAQDILQYLAYSQTIFEGDGSGQVPVTDQISQIWSLMQKVQQFDDTVNFSDRISEIFDLLRDFRNDLFRYAEDIELDPERLELLNRKMANWVSLQRKYGETKDAIYRFYQKSAQRLEDLESLDSRLAKASGEKKELEKELNALSLLMHAERQKIADSLCFQIEEKLAQLRMPNVRFEIRIDLLEEYGENGKDRVVFYIQTNKGLEMRPLHEIASGGELSRVLLAIRSLFAEGIRSRTVVFDEIDAGVSGMAAQSMAEQLFLLSKSMQIISVSHLPQIASMGDHQYAVSKEATENETKSSIVKLRENERVNEIARLLSGAGKTQTAREQAQALLWSAQNWKKDGGIC